MAINFWQLSSEFTYKHLSRKWLVQAANKAFSEMKILNVTFASKNYMYGPVYITQV